MGDRNGRFAMIVDKDGKVMYAEKEQDPRKVTVRREVLIRHRRDR